MGGKPLPLPVWDRDAGKLFDEFMDDHPATYDSRPRRSLTQWLESRRLYDWMIAAYQGSRWSVREIEPFISKHQIDMSEFKPENFLPPPTKWELSPRRAISPGESWTPTKNSP